MSNIVVEYDGSYPAACKGTLKIMVDNEVIYNEQFCCSSTGSCGFDEEWNEEVEDGKLIWNDAKKFPKEIQEAVEDMLSGVSVCCGGCL